MSLRKQKGVNGGVVVNARAACSVCRRLYREPKILPSVHLEGEARSSAVTVLCPECDSEVDILLSGVEWLTTDDMNSVVCDLCSDGDAEKREVCCVNLCEFCCQAHRTGERQKRTSTHTVQCLEDLKTQGCLSRPVLCSLHPGQELRLFWEICDLPICLDCAATFHRDHCCLPTRDVIDRHGDCIWELVTGRLRPRLDRLEESLRKVDLFQEALQARMDVMADEVCSFARGYASAVESHCLSLLRRLVELRLQRRNQLHLQRAQLQQALSDARGGVAFAERLLTCGSDSKILSAKGVTLRRLGEKVGGYPVVGMIHAKTLELSSCIIEGEGLQHGRERQRVEFTLVCRDSAGEQMGRGGEVVLVSMVHKEKKDSRLEAAVVDNSDGSYSISYTPVEPGSYSVLVCVKAQHVKVSPFVLNVKRKVQRHCGMFHCCSFCSSGGSKEARCGCTGTMPGGFWGCGHGHKGHPGKPHWSCCGSVVEASDCLPQSVITAVGGTVTAVGGGAGSGSPRGHLRTVQL
uniref:RING-type E3 ubiquitin transferase n=1 Tax=Salmo trutta TaxID=8032 RepID=A0A673WHE6_SALTR